MIEWVYEKNPPCDFFDVEFEAKDLLSYYGSVLVALATSALSIMTYLQTKRANSKSEEVNYLSLELQKKQMAIAEKSFQEELQRKRSDDKKDKEQDDRVRDVPKFEISILSYSSYYSNLMLKLLNVSDFPASSISSIGFDVLNKNGKKYKDSDGAIVDYVSVAQPKSRNLLKRGDSTTLTSYNYHLAIMQLLGDNYRKLGYISYDSTNKNCQDAGDFGILEYGKAKDEKGTPIFNFSVAMDISNQVPLLYEMYLGSVNDVSQLTCMIDKVIDYG